MSSDAPTTTREVAETLLLDRAERERLLAYARSRFGIGDEDGEDVLQDTAVELLRQRNSVENPKGFLFAVFRHRCVRLLEKRRLRREVFGDAEGLEKFESPADAEKLQRRLALREALDTISSPCRRILAAYYIEGESLQEAAERMAVTCVAVNKTINRCLRRLRLCLA